MRVGFHRQPLQVDTHILLVSEIAGVDSEIVDGVAVFVPLNNCRIAGGIRLHATDCRLVVGNVVADGLEPELGIGNALVVGFSL